MVRAPYPARIAAGLLVTALEETRRLPTLAVTLPMTAVSQTLQAGMRVQQNIAELAIKGDVALEHFFDKADDQPEWARFDEDEVDDTPDPASTVPAVDTDADAVDLGEISGNPSGDEAEDTEEPEPIAGEMAAPQPADAETDTAAGSEIDTAAGSEINTAAGSETGTGRFALYSSAPDTLSTAEDPTPNGPAGPVPEIVEYLEYDGLTLAQLRAKIRSISLPELEQLALYERSTRARAPFLTMLDNRITAQKNKRQSTT